MNKFKKFLLFCMSFVLAFSFLIAPFPQTEEKLASSAPTTNVQLIDDNLLKFVTISSDGETLTNEKLKNYDTNSDGKTDVSYVFTNRTATLTFDSLNYSYSTNFDSSLFYKTTKNITITKLASDEKFPSVFTDNEVEYSYVIDASNNLTITNNTTSHRFTESEFIEYDPLLDTETTRIITVVTSYTLKAEAPSTSFSFIPSNSFANQGKTTQYTINFERPITDFKTEDVTMFTCLGLDVGNSPFTNTKIEKELSYENVKFQITNNDYTEDNPLYFDINHDGFIYTFKLFSKTIEIESEFEEMLFVEYYDEQKNGNNEPLATNLVLDSNDKVDVLKSTLVYKYYGVPQELNMFAIDFNNPGRYEIAIYDETYRLKLNDNNFYSTSFYIKTSDGANANTAFDNAYAIMQKYDEEGNLSDYIVSGSTQNNDVEIILKNLNFYFEHDEVISSLSTEEESTLYAVEFIETTLTGSLNIPVSTYYTVSELKEALETSEDFKIECTKDAFYEVIIYQYQETSDGVYSVKKTKPYQFTIVKNPKISFTVFKVDEHNDPIEIPGTNRFETEIKEADIPYETTPVEYKLNISNEMDVAKFFSSNPSEITTSTLQKTYLNNYTINYAMQLVKIEKIDIFAEGSDNVLDVLGLQFFGVGDISVAVTMNSITTNYTLKSGEQLVFEEYGTYSVSIQDSMGTTGTAQFKFSKPVSFSAIALFALVGVVILIIVLFVISSRGKLKTR